MKTRNLKTTTEWREIDDRSQLRVHYGWSIIGNQSPYFSITCDLRERRRIVGGGCMHDAVDEHFPELAHLIKWHLCAADTGPTHYEADALYHWEQGARKHFESTVVFRALDSDVMGFKHCENEEDKELQLEYIRDWLAERLPFLLMIMHEELTEAGVPELNHSDIGWRVA